LITEKKKENLPKVEISIIHPVSLAHNLTSMSSESHIEGICLPLQQQYNIFMEHKENKKNKENNQNDEIRSTPESSSSTKTTTTATTTTTSTSTSTSSSSSLSTSSTTTTTSGHNKILIYFYQNSGKRVDWLKIFDSLQQIRGTNRVIVLVLLRKNEDGEIPLESVSTIEFETQVSDDFKFWKMNQVNDDQFQMRKEKKPSVIFAEMEYIWSAKDDMRRRIAPAESNETNRNFERLFVKLIDKLVKDK